MIKQLTVKTNRRIEFIDITSDIQKVVNSFKIDNGTCFIHIPHTTAAVTINENADPSVVKDINMQLNKLVPDGAGYLHMEGNSDAHVKASILGAFETVFIEGGKLVLGTWQGIYFSEFDGPRSRKALVKIISD